MREQSISLSEAPSFEKIYILGMNSLKYESCLPF